jgi:hypothetical protein
LYGFLIDHAPVSGALNASLCAFRLLRADDSMLLQPAFFVLFQLINVAIFEHALDKS